MDVSSLIDLPLKFEYMEMDKEIIGILNIISKTCVKRMKEDKFGNWRI